MSGAGAQDPQAGQASCQFQRGACDEAQHQHDRLRGPRAMRRGAPRADHPGRLGLPHAGWRGTARARRTGAGSGAALPAARPQAAGPHEKPLRSARHCRGLVAGGSSTSASAGRPRTTGNSGNRPGPRMFERPRPARSRAAGTGHGPPRACQGAASRSFRAPRGIFPACVNLRLPECNRDAMDDDELIAAAAAGDDSALRELFSRHASWLAARLRSVLPAADVEDVLQETFLGVWRSADRYRPDGTAGGWMWGIARRQAAVFLRRSGPAALVLPAVLAADGRHASDPAEAALSRAAIAEAVVALGPEGSPEREAWRLMYVDDRPVAEVAELMGVPVGTVKSRAHRARRLLRAALRSSDQALPSGPVAEGGDR